MTETTRHWAYRLPVIVHSERGPMHWAHEAIAEHKNPEWCLAYEVKLP